VSKLCNDINALASFHLNNGIMHLFETITCAINERKELHKSQLFLFMIPENICCHILEKVLFCGEVRIRN